MLPFDKEPWAKKLAGTVIALTLIAAVCVPVVLQQRRRLDVPIVVAIVLIVLAIVPPNLWILRGRREEMRRSRNGLLTSRTAR